MEAAVITAVGIDVSKSKSTVAVRRPGGEIALRPFEVHHTNSDLKKLASTLKKLGGDIRIVMEHTSTYWRPIALTLKEAGFFVSVVNAMLIHDFSDNTQLEMQRLAAMLPEYEVVMQMEGAGPITGPALMAEIGDVRRFKNKKALVAFAGIDAPPFQSGAFESKSRHVSKRGSPHLRRTIFIVSNIILTRSNPENAVYCFMDKKRSEGKHYYVYTVAGSAKFLRVYYARVTEFLRSQPSPDAC